MLREGLKAVLCIGETKVSRASPPPPPPPLTRPRSPTPAPLPLQEEYEAGLNQEVGLQGAL